MIPDFSRTIQRDFLNGLNIRQQVERPVNARGRVPRLTEAANKKNLDVGLSRLRLLSTAAMIVGGAVAFKGVAIIFTSTITALVVLALGVGIYAVSHDVFVIAKNVTEQTNSSRLSGELQGYVDFAKSLFNEVVNDGVPQAHPITKDTLFPIWWTSFLNVRRTV